MNMKNILLVLGSLILTLTNFSYAQHSTQTVITPPTPIPWSSKDSNEEITINNGNGNNLTITITVDKPANFSNTEAPGVNIKNCGDTKHIEAGSTAICNTNDPANPVSFSSDNQNAKATGSYLINQN